MIYNLFQQVSHALWAYPKATSSGGVIVYFILFNRDKTNKHYQIRFNRSHKLTLPNNFGKVNYNLIYKVREISSNNHHSGQVQHRNLNQSPIAELARECDDP